MNELQILSIKSHIWKFALAIILLFNTHSIFSQNNHYADSLKTIIAQNSNDTSTVDALIQLSFYVMEEDPGQALEYSTEALTISQNTKWKQGMAWSFLNIGLAYDYMANYDTALVFYQRAFDKSAEINDKNGMGSALFNAGGSYHYRGIYSLALDYYLKALLLYQSTKNEKGITSAYNNLGTIARVQKDYQSALKYYLEVKKIREKNNDQDGLMYVYNNISSLLAYIGNYKASIDYAQKSVDIAISLQKKVDQANGLINLGMSYLSIGKMEEAEKTLLESHRLINETKDLQYKAYVLTGLGELYLKKKDYLKSITFLDSAIYLAALQNRNELLAKTYRILSNCYEKMGSKDKSLEYYKKFDAISDTILNQENLRQMNEMNAIFKVNETKKENTQLYIDKTLEVERASRRGQQRNIFIALLTIVIIISLLLLRSTRKNLRISKELANKNDLIEKSLQEKEILLKEIHHRVKNNLQLVSSLIQLQVNRTNDKNIVDALIESQTRIESMAMIHKYLYSVNNLGKIDMKVYLEQLITSIENTYITTEIELEKRLELQHHSLNIDTAVPLGIITTELISNCFKYAFKATQKNQLTVIYKPVGVNGYQLIIQDNGDNNDLNKINLANDSLGLKLVSLLIKQLRAEIKFENRNGLAITITGQNQI